jgi:2-polyprenyl-6-methoxyphenol hydroxylase-like FAD-dependent oxidoreductase
LIIFHKIAADGYQSSIREMAQISTIQWNYDQFGIVATLQLADNVCLFRMKI